MMSHADGNRRITPTAGDHALKAIAGNLQKLSYRDMQRFSKMLAPSGGAEELADRLLTVADAILETPNGH